ncbi:MAG: hypothetical protein OEV94_09005 [Deltaproteobacteria bacterium]|nr:hypothetical protein [Deltaproteobacteria bacterium]
MNIHLLGHDKKLDEAIAEANSYSKFMDYFEQGEKQIADGTADRNTKKAIPALADMYYLLNELLGKLYFHKNEYSQALVYFKKTYYPQSPKLAKGFKKDFDDYQMMMICAYTQKNYKEALMFVVDSESVTKAPMEKEARAYNIGALNSLLGNKKEAIRWAKKSLAITVNKQHRLKELKEDHDYDAVRDEKEFQDLLKS